ncbi:MAG: efflux RND transporter periplasmic adaptor subunit [Hyphomicrobiaceae bacterium]|jgi:membrane fusion protein (multidrug efflux system)
MIRTGKLGLAFMASLAALLPAACGDSAPKQQQAAPPPSVVVEPVTLHDLAEERTFTGRIEAIDKVQIRARVQGYLKARNFEEGAEVKKDELLFEIEPEPFELAVNQAEANLASAEAGQTLAEQTYQRSLELTDRGTASKASLDSAQSSLRQAQASVKARQADVQTAKLNLSYTKITAPMPGRIGRSAYSVGNLVGPDSGQLALLVKQDPVYVTFPVPYSLLLQVKRGGQSEDGVYIKLRLADGSTYEPEGRIAFADVQATASTDSVTVRGTIANPNRLLIDQQLVNVSVIRRQPEQKLVISQSALLLDQQGTYALVVDDKNKVAIQRIKVGEQRGALIVVDSGLSADQRVIVSGHQKARPGAQVDPQVASTAPTLPNATPTKR